jgi:hypothetical protein
VYIRNAENVFAEMCRGSLVQGEVGSIEEEWFSGQSAPAPALLAANFHFKMPTRLLFNYTAESRTLDNKTAEKRAR